jgi:hypothetical protein
MARIAALFRSDIMAVVHQCSPIETMTMFSGAATTKRTVALLDKSSYPRTIELTLWGDRAESVLDMTIEHPVLVCKNVKVIRFSGRTSLTAAPMTQLVVNPDTADAREIKMWYNALDPNTVVTSSEASQSSKHM